MKHAESPAAREKPAEEETLGGTRLVKGPIYLGGTMWNNKSPLFYKACWSWVSQQRVLDKLVVQIDSA